MRAIEKLDAANQNLLAHFRNCEKNLASGSVVASALQSTHDGRPDSRKDHQ
jgi:hypothetical protein